jgi:hypothetical protein
MVRWGVLLVHCGAPTEQTKEENSPQGQVAENWRV